MLKKGIDYQFKSNDRFNYRYIKLQSMGTYSHVLKSMQMVQSIGNGITISKKDLRKNFLVNFSRYILMLNSIFSVLMYVEDASIDLNFT